MTTATLMHPETVELLIGDIDAEWLALDEGTDPTELPEWLTDDEPRRDDIPVKGYVARLSTGRERCPWLDVEVPANTGSLAVQDAAVASMLDQPVAFIKSPTAKHAHDGTALAMIDHAAAELRAALKQRSVPRGDLRSLLHQLEAML